MHGGIENRYPAALRQLVEQFQRPLLRLVEPRLAAQRVFHARARVDDQHCGDRLPAGKRQPFAEDFGPGQRQADRGDQQDSQQKQQQMPELKLPLVQAVLLHEKPQRRKLQVFRLLPHDQMHQDRHAD